MDFTEKCINENPDLMGRGLFCQGESLDLFFEHHVLKRNQSVTDHEAAEIQCRDEFFEGYVYPGFCIRKRISFAADIGDVFLAATAFACLKEQV